MVQEAFEIPIRVYHEDTDSGGIVYYANYLKFMERARTEYLRSLGFEQDQLKDDHQCLFVVTHVDVSYHQPAIFNEKLTASCELLELRKASFKVRQLVCSAPEGSALEHENDSANDSAESGMREKKTSSTVSLACLNSETLAPCRIPESLSRCLGSICT